jgi:hypothetical protein
MLRRGDEHSRRVGEKLGRLEDDFGSGRNTERLDDDIDVSQRGFTVAISSASPAIFSSCTRGLPTPLGLKSGRRLCTIGH